MTWEKIGGGENENLPRWDYGIEPELIGECTDKNLGVEVKGKKLNFYSVEKEDGEAVSILGTKILDDFFSKVEIGQNIKLVYKGEVQGKNNTYKSFECFREKLEE